MNGAVALLDAVFQQIGDHVGLPIEKQVAVAERVAEDRGQRPLQVILGKVEQFQEGFVAVEVRDEGFERGRCFRILADGQRMDILRRGTDRLFRGLFILFFLKIILGKRHFPCRHFMKREKRDFRQFVAVGNEGQEAAFLPVGQGADDTFRSHVEKIGDVRQGQTDRRVAGTAQQIKVHL